jgi:nucleoside-diphosphate-sugar epimerase
MLQLAHAVRAPTRQGLPGKNVFMKILFIGGTGFISTSVSKLAVERGNELYLLNRGRSQQTVEGAVNAQLDRILAAYA